MSADRWFGARTMVWLLIWVVASGTVLMLWFDGDAARHAAALGWFGTLMRIVHATTTAWLVVGSLVHIIRRLRLRPTFTGLWTGAVLWVALGIALISGWLSSQTWVQQQIHAVLPVSATTAAVVHIAYAGILVTVGLGLHITRWGWRRILSPGRPLVGSLILVAASLVLPVAMPGDLRPWHGITAWLAVPVGGMWLWPLVVALGLAYAATISRQPPSKPSAGRR